MKETVAKIVTKDMLAFMKDNKGFTDHIVSSLSRDLSDRLIQILNSEGEIIVKQSDLIVGEVNDTEFDRVEYRRFLNWEHLVRCKDCKHHDGIDGQCPVQSTGDPFYDYKPDDNWYCGDGERSEDEA